MIRYQLTKFQNCSLIATSFCQIFKKIEINCKELISLDEMVNYQNAILDSNQNKEPEEFVRIKVESGLREGKNSFCADKAIFIKRTIDAFEAIFIQNCEIFCNQNEDIHLIRDENSVAITSVSGITGTFEKGMVEIDEEYLKFTEDHERLDYFVIIEKKYLTKAVSRTFDFLK
jgi:hypothetical protein